MKDIKQKPKMKGAKVLDAASKVPQEMKDVLIKMREQAPDRSKNYDSQTEYGESVIKEQAEHAVDSTVHVAGRSIHKAADSAKEHYTENAAYKGGREHAEKQPEPAYRADVFETNTQHTQTPKTQPKNTVSQIKQGSHSVKSTQKTVKAGTKTVKAADRSIKTIKKTQKTANTAKKSGNAVKKTAKKAKDGIKAAGKALMRMFRAIAAGIRNIIIAIAAGGWVAVLVIIIIAVITLVLCSAFGVFSSNDTAGEGKPMTELIMQIDSDYQQEIKANIARLSTGGFDEVKVIYTGDADGDSAAVNNWNDVIAVYAVLTTTDTLNPMDVAVLTEAQSARLREVFNAMNSAVYDTKIEAIEEETANEDGETIKTEKTVCTVYVTLKSMDYMEAAGFYCFEEQQMEILEEMVRPEYNAFYAELIGVDVYGGTDITQIISGLPPNLKGSEVVKAAVTKLGSPYVLGAKGENQFDCSGLAYWAINQVDPALGGRMYTNAAGQAKYCYDNNKIVGESELLPGDLVFWQNLGCSGCGRWNEIHHVGIYMGDGKVIEASSSKGRVVIRDLWSSSGYPLFMYGRPY